MVGKQRGAFLKGYLDCSVSLRFEVHDRNLWVGKLITSHFCTGRRGEHFVCDNSTFHIQRDRKFMIKTDPLINFDYYSKDIFPKVFLEEDCGRLCQ